MTLKDKMKKLAQAANKASKELALLPTNKKNKILKDMAKALKRNKDLIIKENAKDLTDAKKKGLSKAMLDRLALSEARLDSMVKSIFDVVKLKDPVGRVLNEWKRPNGLKIAKVSVPLGVVMVIYEARPNVTAECVSLALKSGNSIILKGGSEAFYSNKIIAKLFSEVIIAHGIHKGAVSFVASTDRASVDALLKLDEYISVVVPRGGEGLIRKVVESSRIPVIKHYKGVCHIYVDKSADVDMATLIVLNAKLSRPAVCNALETLLVHKDIADEFLPMCMAKLQDKGCQIRGCKQTKKRLPYFKDIKLATKDDYYAEYLDLILAVKVVDSIEEAVEHIAVYGSAHTDAIVANSKKAVEYFVNCVDSASVMVNTSTRFSDGNEFGLGAEIGISTDKIHARGPMGLDGLTSYKYVVKGKGQIRV